MLENCAFLAIFNKELTSREMYKVAVNRHRAYVSVGVCVVYDGKV